MTEEDKIKAIAEMHVKMKEDGVSIIHGDNVEIFVEGIMPNISIGKRGFQDPPYIAQRIDVGLDGDQVQVLPLNDEENNYYYSVVKHKRRELTDKLSNQSDEKIPKNLQISVAVIKGFMGITNGIRA